MKFTKNKTFFLFILVIFLLFPIEFSVFSKDNLSLAKDHRKESKDKSIDRPMWFLMIHLIQTQFGTHDATVVLNGPFGFQDNKSINTGPFPIVNFIVPVLSIPPGYPYQVCVSSNNMASTIVPNCQVFVHLTNNDNEVQTMEIP